MASHAYTTSALLRPAQVAHSALLPAYQVGPVTAAVRTMRRDHADEIDRERAALHALRKAIADRIEADIALLDELTPDPDLEPLLGALEWKDWTPARPWSTGATDDREDAQCWDDGERRELLAPEGLRL